MEVYNDWLVVSYDVPNIGKYRGVLERNNKYAGTGKTSNSRFKIEDIEDMRELKNGFVYSEITGNYGTNIYHVKRLTGGDHKYLKNIDIIEKKVIEP